MSPVSSQREESYIRAADGDTCGDCGVGAGEHASDCPRLAMDEIAEEDRRWTKVTP